MCLCFFLLFQTIAQKLDTDLKMNRSSFSEAINQLISEITDAQNHIQINGTKMLQEVYLFFHSEITFFEFIIFRRRENLQISSKIKLIAIYTGL